MNLPEMCETGLSFPPDGFLGDFFMSGQKKPRECGEKVTTALILRVTPASAGKSKKAMRWECMGTGHPCKRREVTYVSKYYDLLAML